MVDMQTTMWPGLAPLMMPRSPTITLSGLVCGVDDQDGPIDCRLHRLGVARQARRAWARTAAGLALVDVVHRQLVAGFREIEGHRPAHGAGPDESDLAGHCSSFDSVTGHIPLAREVRKVLDVRCPSPNLSQRGSLLKQQFAKHARDVDN